MDLESSVCLSIKSTTPFIWTHGIVSHPCHTFVKANQRTKVKVTYTFTLNSDSYRMFQHTFKVFLNAHVKCGFFGIFTPPAPSRLYFRKWWWCSRKWESDGVRENSCALLSGLAKIWVNVCGAFTYFRLSTTRPCSITNWNCFWCLFHRFCFISSLEWNTQ